ncbi:MAG: DUF4278 domain-containing protein [Moorea sp. SIO4G2]|nr:DUF4278 domain-containing protein [Moorena sp. SIO4G2]
MKLRYRGVSYDAEPSLLEVREGEIGGTYRAQNWRVHYPRHMPEPPPVNHLKWRGVSYCTGNATVTNTVADSQPMAKSISTVAAKTSIARHRLQKVLNESRKVHLATMRQTLEHRLEVAKANGDQNLVRLLEDESKQMQPRI